MKGVINVKKDRDCGGMAYPVYPQMVPNFGGMVMPGQMIPMPNNNMGVGMTNVPLTSVQSTINSNDLTNLTNQVNNLEQRVTRLENTVNKTNYNNYNSSNYPMM